MFGYASNHNRLGLDPGSRLKAAVSSTGIRDRTDDATHSFYREIVRASHHARGVVAAGAAPGPDKVGLT